MKRIALLLVIAILGTTAVFAAPPKTTSKVVVKEVVVMERSGSANATAGKMAIGTAIGCPTIRYNFSDDLSGTAGLTYSSGAGASTTALLAKVDYNLQKMGMVQPTVGLYYTTDGAAAATTVIAGTYGINTMIQPNLSIGADITVASSTSAAGATTTGILSGAALNLALYL